MPTIQELEEKVARLQRDKTILIRHNLKLLELLRNNDVLGGDVIDEQQLRILKQSVTLQEKIFRPKKRSIVPPGSGMHEETREALEALGDKDVARRAAAIIGRRRR